MTRSQLTRLTPLELLELLRRQIDLALPMLNEPSVLRDDASLFPGPLSPLAQVGDFSIYARFPDYPEPVKSSASAASWASEIDPVYWIEQLIAANRHANDLSRRLKLSEEARAALVHGSKILAAENKNLKELLVQSNRDRSYYQSLACRVAANLPPPRLRKRKPRKR